MPLFHRLGLPDDCTQLYDENPDPTIYTEVVTQEDFAEAKAAVAATEATATPPAAPAAS